MGELYLVRGGVYGCWLYCLIRVGSCMCRGEHRSGRDAKFHIATHSRCGAVWYCVGVGGRGWHGVGLGLIMICYGLEGSQCHITHHLWDGERYGKVLN